jgi:hypothetical protein
VLFAALFVLIWVRHLANLSQLATWLLTFAVFAGWVALGSVALSARAVGQAAMTKRALILLYPLIPLLVVALIALRCHRQAIVVERIWAADRNLKYGNIVDFADGSSLTNVAKDRKMNRYFGVVEGVRFSYQKTDLRLFPSIAKFRALRHLTCELDADEADQFAQIRRLTELEVTLHGDANLAPLTKLSRLQQLTVTLDGDADFAPLRQLTSVTNLHLVWSRSAGRSLESLAGLPMMELYVEGGDALSDADVAALIGISTLSILELRDMGITQSQKTRLREGLPSCTVILSEER